MCNWIQKGLANGVAKIPAYRPYLVHRLCAHPWLPNKSDHGTSYENWSANSRQVKRRTLPQELPIQSRVSIAYAFSWMRNVARHSAISGDQCSNEPPRHCAQYVIDGERKFGSHSYFRLLGSRLEENARMRVLTDEAYLALLSTEKTRCDGTGPARGAPIRPGWSSTPFVKREWGAFFLSTGRFLAPYPCSKERAEETYLHDQMGWRS